MKTLSIATAFFVAMCAPATSWAEGGFTGDEAYDKAAGAFSAATGAMILGTIEYDGDGPQIGVGVGNIGGHSGIGVKFMTPLGSRFHGAIGTYRIEDGSSGAAAAITFKF